MRRSKSPIRGLCDRVPIFVVLPFCLFGHLAAGIGQATAQPLLKLEGDTSDPSVSPDGKRIAFVWSPRDETKWGIYIAPTSGGLPDLLVGVDDRGAPLFPKWSRDGKWIAFLRAGSSEQAGLFVKSMVSGVERFLGDVCIDREVWSANGDSVVATAFHPSRNADLDLRELCAFPIKPGAHSHELGVFGSSPAISRDGKMLAFVHNDEIRLLPLTPDDRHAGATTTLLREASGISDVAWDAAKNQILYVPAGDRSRIRCASPGSGSAHREIANVEGEILSLDFTSGGRLIAGVMSRESSLWTIDLRSPDNHPARFREFPWNVGPASVSPDGERLTYAVKHGDSSEVYISDPAGDNPRLLLKMAYRIDQLTWLPNGEKIAIIAESGHAQLEPSHLFVASAVDGSPRRLLDQFESVYEADWSHDGKTLFAVARAKGADGIWKVELANGRAVRIDDRPARQMQVSHDDRFLYRVSDSLVRGSVGGGAQELVASGVLQYAIGKNEIYFERQDSKPPSAAGLNLYRMDLADGPPQFVANIGFVPSTMQLSMDGQHIYMERNGPLRMHIVAIQGWH